MQPMISSQWRMLSQRPTCSPPPTGLDRLWRQAAALAGRLSHRSSHFLGMADNIVVQAKNYHRVSDRQLQDLTDPLRNRFRLGRDTAADRQQGLAMLCEVARRTVGLRPYREQVACALALNAGCVAEMATGEGKTLVATLPAILAGWRGRGCHIVTANDYLARRDADWMRPMYRFCGLDVGCIAPGMAAVERRQAYQAHISYCTSKEVAADFLRDRLTSGNLEGLPALLLAKMVSGRDDRIGRLVQRGLEYAIVDEADSVFIDDASTPLLISGEGPNQEQVDAYNQAARLAARLDPSIDFRIDRHDRGVQLTSTGKQHLARLAEPWGGLWTGSRRREELVLQALVAETFYIRDKHYVVDDDKVVIVDAFTGRLMPDRTWRNGLHQAVEAKEKLPINLPQETHARISFQRFFRLYRNLAGMSGTVAEAQAELWEIYRMPVVSIPTHRPCRRLVKPDRIFTTAAAKWQAVIAEIRAVHRTRRPILIGTGSIRDSQYLSDRLTAKGIAHRLLNAVQKADEARIIAHAGREGQITVATTMAGRGTDIQLGTQVAQLGGLHVIATERFASRRIDRQLSGRGARQGDPGSSQAFISLDDDFFGNDNRSMLAGLRRFYGKQDREIVATVWLHIVSALQRQAERASCRMRKYVLSTDNWLEQHLGFAPNEY